MMDLPIERIPFLFYHKIRSRYLKSFSEENASKSRKNPSRFLKWFLYLFRFSFFVFLFVCVFIVVVLVVGLIVLALVRSRVKLGIIWGRTPHAHRPSCWKILLNWSQFAFCVCHRLCVFYLLVSIGLISVCLHSDWKQKKKKTNRQPTNKQTNKHPNKQPTNQTNKQKRRRRREAKTQNKKFISSHFAKPFLRETNASQLK